MASVNDGVYRITLDRRQALTADGRDNLVLLPESNGEQVWQVERTGNDTYIIRQPTAPRFVGYDGEPETFERVRTYPRPQEWTIIEGPNPGTVTIGVPGNNLTLGLHPALIFPPLVALSPIFGEDRGWTLESIE